MSPSRPSTSRRPKGSGGLFQRCDAQYGCPPAVPVADDDGKVTRVRPAHKCKGLWVGRVEAGFDRNGNRRRLQVTAKTKPEAEKRKRDLEIRLAKGDVPAAGSGSRATVKSWADEWLPMHKKEVRPRVFDTDRGAVRKWIVPTLGTRRLVDLNPGDLRRLAQAVTGAGRSSTTALNVHAVFVKMLRDARLEGGHGVPDRIFDVRRPRAAASDRAQIPVDQALRLLEAVGRRGDSSRWIIGMLYGIRQAERLGLCWDSVDLDEPSMVIEWQLQAFAKDAVVPDWLRTRHLTGRYWLTETKTRKGERWLPLLPIAAASLAALKAEAAPNPHGLVWTDAAGQPIAAHRDRQAWHAIQEEAGVAHPSGRPWLLHECRHTMVSMLIDDGVDRSVIAAIVGQSQVVESYVHVDRDAVRRALSSMATRWQIEG